MPKCDHCGKQCNLHSFHCSYCGGTYCGDHRLPFSHNCINEADWRKGTPKPRYDNKSKRENSNLPITECVFCGVKTSKIFYCTSCGHNYCSKHKWEVDHNCKSQRVNDYQKSSNLQRTVRPSNSASSNQNFGVFLVIVAIVLGAIFAFAVYGYPGGSDTTNQPAVTAVNYVIPKPTASQYTPVSVTETPKSIFSPVAIPTTNLETGPTPKSFPYVLRGKTGSISTMLYSGIQNHQISLSQPAACIRYNGDSSSCTQEEIRQYYLKYMDEPTQKNNLNELVKRIKSQTSNKDDQARIAISLVQNIPYDYNQLSSLSTEMKYPYEVLYQDKGVCSEKSILLAYILRELGYGVVLFEFNSENHMAVGIQSPSQYSYRDSGYAFIEATTPSIVTDSNADYVGAGKLTSTPKIMQISQGDSFSSVSEEYRDAQLYNQLISMGQVLDVSYYNLWVGLVQKYGMKTSGGSLYQGSTLPSQGYNSQSYYETCDITSGRYCQAGSNCCQNDGLCYMTCSRGVWDPRECVCIVG